MRARCAVKRCAVHNHLCRRCLQPTREVKVIMPGAVDLVNVATSQHRASTTSLALKHLTSTCRVAANHRRQTMVAQRAQGLAAGFLLRVLVQSSRKGCPPALHRAPGQLQRGGSQPGCFLEPSRNSEWAVLSRRERPVRDLRMFRIRRKRLIPELMPSANHFGDARKR